MYVEPRGFRPDRARKGLAIAPTKRPSVQKRAREKKKAEQAAAKRDQRSVRRDDDARGAAVATREELEGYGLIGEAPAELPDEDPRAKRP